MLPIIKKSKNFKVKMTSQKYQLDLKCYQKPPFDVNDHNKLLTRNGVPTYIHTRHKTKKKLIQKVGYLYNKIQEPRTDT